MKQKQKTKNTKNKMRQIKTSVQKYS